LLKQRFAAASLTAALIAALACSSKPLVPVEPSPPATGAAGSNGFDDAGQGGAAGTFVLGGTSGAGAGASGTAGAAGAGGAVSSVPTDPLAIACTDKRPGSYYSWTDIHDVPGFDRFDFMDVWGSGANDVWIVGGLTTTPEPPAVPSGPVGAIFHWDGATWSSVAPCFGVQFFESVWGLGPNDVWVAGDNQVLKWDGAGWYDFDQGDQIPGGIIDVWGTAVDDIWELEYVLTGYVARHYTGSSWVTVSPNANGPALYSTWGSSAEDTWIVGAAGTVLHWDGTALTTVKPLVATDLRSVWGTGPDDVWAVGSDVIIHWDGAEWTKSWTGPPLGLVSVWSSDPQHAWAVGQKGALMHWNGQSWGASGIVAPQNAAAISVPAQNDGWIVGPGAVQHF
jgi:hypothetical protein